MREALRATWYEYWAAAFWQTSWHLIIKWSVLPIDDDDLPPTFEATSGVPWGTAGDFYKKVIEGFDPSIYDEFAFVFNLQ